MYGDISLEQAWQILQDHRPSLGHEVVSTANALERTLLKTLYAEQDLPPEAQSAVDGFALAENQHADSNGYRLCHGEQSTGCIPEILEEGQALPVNTGGILPRGTVAVVPHEKTAVEGQHLRLLSIVKTGDNIKKAGEDFARNDVVLTVGTRVDPTALGLLAALGIGEIEVLQRPRVAIVCLADNIVPGGTEPGRGQMRDSNGPMLSGFITQQGGIVTSVHYASDTADSMPAVVEKLCGQTELILLVGGTYQNGENASRLLMKDVGAQILFWGVPIQPGSHTGAGKMGNTLLLSLSGNPAACAVNYHLFAAPVIRGMQGLPWYYRQVPARCRNGFSKRTGTRRFVRGKAVWQDSGWEVEVLPGQKPSMLRSWLGCNALVDLPPGGGPIEAGGEVQVLLLSDYRDV